MSDGHSDFFLRWWVDVYGKICACRFDVRWIHWSRPIQEFLEVFYPSVPLLLNFGDWLAFFVFDPSLWFTVFPC
ncbi:unnamed protein product [Schistosoma margrebowiei]|uniref:Uncharacterized protein n=1 Tax=Schistosoma margrebowiei TaxID=48269 RepID=A0A3P8BGJ0_9TREM|nr:unnamed protein product [Schistosoma margrebowiei]